MKLIAGIISRIFDPLIEIPFMLSLSVWYAYMNGLAWKFLTVLLFVDALIPFVFFIFLYKKKIIKDWDISNRKQRIPVYGFTMLAHLAGVGMAFLTGRIIEAKILFAFWLLGMIFFVITNYWKISVHAGVNAALVTFMTIIVSPNLIWLFVILIPVGWARIYSRNHSLAEYTAGAVIATLGIWCNFWILGLI